MSYFKNIKLENYRNFNTSSFEFNNRCNIIVGSNGAGKTNLLEWLSLFEKGKGFRKDKIDNLINFDSNLTRFNINGVFINDSNQYDISTFNEINNDKFIKKIFINNNDDRDSLKYFENLLSFIYFLPEMERLFVSSPSLRRNFIDRLIYSKDKKYNSVVNRFKKNIIERQQLLKSGNYDNIWIENIEKNIAELALQIYIKRFNHIDILNKTIDDLDIAKKFSNNFFLKISDNFIKKNPEIYESDGEIFYEQLKENRKIDLIAGGCSIGPHRSDIVGYKVGTDFNISQFSTGQQKTVILLLIIAQCRYLIKRENKNPILLLDEVCSHLDANNRELLLYLVNELNVQVFMTGTEKKYFSFLSTKAYYCNIA